MKNFKYFIGGITTILFIIPIANSLLELIQMWIDTLKIKPTKKILEGEKDMVLLREFLCSPNEDTVYEDDYEDNDE